MTKLLTVDLRSSVPRPEANPEITELLDEIHLNSGQSEAHRWAPVRVMLTDDRESPSGLTDFLVTVPFLMASVRLVSLLEKFNCECEYLPLIVHYHKKKINDRYFALNALHVIDSAIDLQQSKIGIYHHELGLARDVEKLMLKANVLGKEPLSFLEEIGHFAVSEEIAEAIADANLIGIKLLKPEEFSS